MKLKSLLFLLTFLVFVNQLAMAQKPVRTYLKLQGEYKLKADNPLIEANEQSVIDVMIDNRVLSEFKHQPLPAGTPAEQELLPSQLDEFPWKIENWRIVQGGGSLKGIGSDTERIYQAPAKAPPGNTILISVDLNSKYAGDPKIVLLQTLYFTEAENAVYLEMPEIGAVHSKYVSKTDAGIKVPTMQKVDPRVAARMSPEIRAQMAAAQAEMAAAQAQSGINLSAATSNAMALYDEQSDITTVKLKSLALQYNDSRLVASTAGSGILEFSFKGQGEFMDHSLDHPGSGVAFMLTFPPPAMGVSCGNNNGSETFVCHGTVKLRSERNDKFIRGTLEAEVYTTSLDGKKIYQGFLYGKFKVNRANEPFLKK